MTVNQMFINTIGGNNPNKTATVYINGKPYATYSKAIAIECANELHGDAVDDETGEVLN